MRPLVAGVSFFFCTLSGVTAACAAAQPVSPRVVAASPPAPRAPGGCERQLELLAETLQRTGVASRPSSVAAFTDAAAVLRELRGRDPTEADTCGRRLEPLLRQQALAARREDHRHQNTPGAEVLLALHRELFPAADRDGVVAFELGNSIADLTLCGCQGRQNDPSRWREVLSTWADARRAPEVARASVHWMGKTVPLPEALDLGEALLRGALDGGRADLRSWPARQ